jgi:hypothetical protein
VQLQSQVNSLNLLQTKAWLQIMQQQMQHHLGALDAERAVQLLSSLTGLSFRKTAASEAIAQPPADWLAAVLGHVEARLRADK